MKVVLSSDLHLDAVTAGVERLPELAEHVQSLCQFGQANPGSGLIVMGDYFDPGGRRDVVYAAWLIQAWRRLRAQFDWSVWLAGNHDVLEMSQRDEYGMPHTTLSPLRAVVAHDHDVTEYCRAIVAVVPYCVLRFAPVGLVLLPFCAAAVRRDGAIARDEALALEQARFHLTNYTRGTGQSTVIVAGHRTIAGVVPGSETDAMPRGGDYPFPEAALQLYRDFPGRVVLANGHYHEPQTFMLDGCPIVIPGCPFRATFGELGGPDRGFVVIDTEELGD